MCSVTKWRSGERHVIFGADATPGRQVIAIPVILSQRKMYALNFGVDNF